GRARRGRRCVAAGRAEADGPAARGGVRRHRGLRALAGVRGARRDGRGAARVLVPARLTADDTCEAGLVTDPGLFGPESVTWRVQSDPIMWIAGLRALLLQAVHPAAMAGILDHSDFRADPWGRLFRTADYVGTVAFGSSEEVA